MKELGLWELREKSPAHISHGQKRFAAFATVLVLASEADNRMSYLAVLIASVAFVHALVYVGFRVATPLHSALGDTGTAVITRVLGIILAAVSVQLVVDGVSGLDLF